MTSRLSPVRLAATLAIAAGFVGVAHADDATALAAASKEPGAVVSASGLVFKSIKDGTGPSPKATDKVTVNWHFIAENVKGIPANSLQKANDVSNDLPGDGTSTYTLTPPASGWPTGTYKVVADMMVDGTQKDEKTVEFTVGQ